MNWEWTGEEKEIDVARGKDKFTHVKLRRICYPDRPDLDGGWLERKANLNKFGKCRVINGAIVSGHAKISGDAVVSDDAWVCGKSLLYGRANVRNAFLSSCLMNGNASVSGSVSLFNSIVIGEASVKLDEPFSVPMYNVRLSGNSSVREPKDLLLVAIGGDMSRSLTFTPRDGAWHFWNPSGPVSERMPHTLYEAIRFVCDQDARLSEASVAELLSAVQRFK